jgi:hypothetical protein
MEMRLWKSWNPLVNTIFGLEAHWNVSATEHRSISIVHYAEEPYHMGFLTPESFYQKAEAASHFTDRQPPLKENF